MKNGVDKEGKGIRGSRGRLIKVKKRRKEREKQGGGRKPQSLK